MQENLLERKILATITSTFALMLMMAALMDTGIQHFNRMKCTMEWDLHYLQWLLGSMED